MCVLEPESRSSQSIHDVRVLRSVVTMYNDVLGVLLLGAAVLVGTADAGKCQRITAPVCLDLRYNVTAMPNKMGHENQEDAGIQVREKGFFFFN